MFLTPAEAALVRERFGTPCYVYDRAALEAAARAALAFPHAFGFTLRYAMKANSNRAVLRLFPDLGRLPARGEDVDRMVSRFATR